nr:LINE-type retrotransposon LIb DNA [Ipomoea batatas]
MPTTATAPDKPRYGSWMLVTRKEKSTSQQVKNPRQNKKPSNPVPSRGNQFNVLADNHDLGESQMTQKNTEKNTARTGAGQRSKGKSPVSNATTLNHPPPTQAVATQPRSNV